MNIWLIHCAGKVASVSLSRALARAGLASGPSRVFKTHLLNPTTLARAGARTGSGGHLAASDEFLRLFSSGEFDRCHVIVGQRDPVAQAVSAFFQSIPDYTGRDHVTRADQDDVLERLHSSIPSLINFMTEVWWKRELAEVFGVDALEMGFDKESGFSCTEVSAKLTFVLYTVERGLRHLAPLLEDLSGKPSIQIGHLNSVSDPDQYKPYANRKEIGDLYAAVQARFRLPASTLEEVYGGRCATFFYDPKQIEAFVARWRA